MDKYKDFEELPTDYSEQDLRNLFVKRQSREFDDPQANDIIIHTAGVNGKEIYSNPDSKVSTFDERMALLKKMGKEGSIALSVSGDSDLETAKFELKYLKPSEIESRYLRKKVEAYRKLCRKFINEEEKNPTKNDPSEVRARAFCIALIQELGKDNFINGDILLKNKIKRFAKETWKLKGDNAGETVYREFIGMVTRQNIISNILKGDYPREYNRGIELYKELFPD